MAKDYSSLENSNEPEFIAPGEYAFLAQLNSNKGMVVCDSLEGICGKYEFMMMVLNFAFAEGYHQYGDVMYKRQRWRLVDEASES